MVRHSDTTRAAKGRGAAPLRETPQGVREDVPACEGLEEPARTSPLDPMEVLTHSVEELDCRVAELDRQMLTVAQRADAAYEARWKAERLRRDLDDVEGWLATAGTVAAVALCAAVLAIMFCAGVI